MPVHQYTYQHVGHSTKHTGPSRGLFGSFWPMWAVCSVHTGRLGVSTSTQIFMLGYADPTMSVADPTMN